MSLMSNRIRACRKQLGMTQAELADKLGIQNSAVAKYENGRVSNIKRSTIQAMADIFNVSPVWLMGIEDEHQVSLTDNQRDLIDKITRLDDSKVATLLELCDLYLSARDKTE